MLGNSRWHHILTGSPTHWANEASCERYLYQVRLGRFGAGGGEDDDVTDRCYRVFGWGHSPVWRILSEFTVQWRSPSSSRCKSGNVLREQRAVIGRWSRLKCETCLMKRLIKTCKNYHTTQFRQTNCIITQLREFWELQLVWVHLSEITFILLLSTEKIYPECCLPGSVWIKMALSLLIKLNSVFSFFIPDPPVSFLHLGDVTMKEVQHIQAFAPLAGLTKPKSPLWQDTILTLINTCSVTWCAAVPV